MRRGWQISKDMGINKDNKEKRALKVIYNLVPAATNDRFGALPFGCTRVLMQYTYAEEWFCPTMRRWKF